MYRKIARIICIALVCVATMGTLASCNKDNTPDGYQLIACEGDKFRLYVPTQWMSSTQGGITSAIYSMDDNVTVSVYVADDAGELSVEDYWTLCDSKLKAELDAYSWSGKGEKTVLGGKAAYKCVYSANVTLLDHSTGETSDVTYKYMQVMAIHDGEMYVLLFSAPEELYDKHVATVEGNADGEGIIPYFAFSTAYHSDEADKQYSDKVTAPEGMKLISTNERAYRFFVPVDWKVNVRTQATAAYVEEEDGRRSNVSVQMYMTGDETQTVDQYWELCKKSYGEIFDTFNQVSATEIQMSGISARRYVYDVTSGDQSYRQLQAIVKKGAMFYVVTYTASPEAFDSHIADVDKMIEKFEIRKGNN